MFEVVGMDDDCTVLHECDSSAEAIDWAKRYTRRDCTWPLVHVYDMRGEAGEVIWRWENEA